MHNGRYDMAGGIRRDAKKNDKLQQSSQWETEQKRAKEKRERERERERTSESKRKVKGLMV